MALADLDELINACRNPKSRLALAEAVACYKAGAYRSCIVSTWLAVTFDYVGKLRDPEIGGNAAAATLVARFETVREHHDLSGALDLERKLIKSAISFDLLSPLEALDLERLFEDRNRCAHPSMNSLEEPYQPSAELARMHLRNAVAHLLSQRPLQGKEAFNRIWGRISSELFPEDTVKAVKVIKEELARARPSLVRKLVLKLATDLARGDWPNPFSPMRLVSALNSIIELHRVDATAALDERFSSIVDECPDKELYHVFLILTEVPLVWEHTGEGQRERLKRYVLASSDHDLVLGLAAELPAFRREVQERLESLTDEELGQHRSNRPVVLNEVLRRMTGESFTTFKVLRDNFIKKDTRWSVEQKRRLVEILVSNSDLQSYMGYESLIGEVLALCGDDADVLKREWGEVCGVLSTRKGVGVQSALKKIQNVFDDFCDVGPVSEDD